MASTLNSRLHAVDDDIEMQLAHAGNNGLTGFFIGVNTERRIFLRQLAQRNTHLLLVSLGLWLNSNGNHRIREIHALQRDDFFQVTQRVARGHILEANRCRDIAGAHFLDFFTGVGVHLQDTSDTLFLSS